MSLESTILPNKTRTELREEDPCFWIRLVGQKQEDLRRNSVFILQDAIFASNNLQARLPTIILFHEEDKDDGHVIPFLSIANVAVFVHIGATLTGGISAALWRIDSVY